MRYLLTLILALLFVVPIHATTLTFGVAPSMIGSPIGPGEIDFHSNDLNGIVLTGQPMSLDVIFANDVLMRVGMLEPQKFWVSLIFSTSSHTAVGAAGPTTGYLLYPGLVQADPTVIGGRGYSDTGMFGIGLGNMLPDLSRSAFIDLAGVHFDTSMPNAAGFTITDVNLRFSIMPGWDVVRFGTIAQLPEPSSLMLLPFGLVGIVLMKRRGGRPLW